MQVGLFIPCYVDQFYPAAAIATLELLEKYGVEVNYPIHQTCCGQPMANSGYENYGKDTTELFLKNFGDFEYIVAPSGSCTLHVKDHILKEDRGPKIYELCEFLTDVVQVRSIDASFPYRVGLHASCHGLRGLNLARPSERMDHVDFNKPLSLLQKLEGIEVVTLSRKDECCGFGGTFAVFEEAVSVNMGKDRIEDHEQHGVEVLTSADMSCLMHLEGLLKRKKSPMKVRHIAEILNGNPL